MSYSQPKNELLPTKEWATPNQRINYSQRKNKLLPTKEWAIPNQRINYSQPKNEQLPTKEWATPNQRMSNSQIKNELLPPKNDEWVQRLKSNIGCISLFHTRLPKLPANAIKIGQATWTIWTAYSLILDILVEKGLREQYAPNTAAKKVGKRMLSGVMAQSRQAIPFAIFNCMLFHSYPKMDEWLSHTRCTWRELLSHTHEESVNVKVCCVWFTAWA